jgi:hypothetical protein
MGLAGAMLAAAVILEAAGSVAALLSRLLGWASPRWAAYISVSLAIAAFHTLLLVGLLGGSIAAGDSGQQVPLTWHIAMNVLGTPLMHLLQLPPDLFAPYGRWWGDDSNFMIGLAILNGLLWGSAVTWLIARWRERGAGSAAA